MTKDKCKEEFEVFLRKLWAKKAEPFLRECNDPEPDRDYQDYDADFAWVVWQAAYNRTQPEAIEPSSDVDDTNVADIIRELKSKIEEQACSED